MSDPIVSIILPVHNQADHLEEIVTEYERILKRSPAKAELLIVTNKCTDESPIIAEQLSKRFPDSVRWIDSDRKGWGAAVRSGMRHARGGVICYTNCARTSPEDLLLLLAYAYAYPQVVVKANRKIRDPWIRRLGSLIYNLECRSLFDLSHWDINGTPKVFPKEFAKLLELSRDDDLIDLEFAIICSEAGYPMIEVPIFSWRRHGGRSTTKLPSALRMYWGALQLRRRTAWRDEKR